jgi:hypothetical protein
MLLALLSRLGRAPTFWFPSSTPLLLTTAGITLETIAYGKMPLNMKKGGHDDFLNNRIELEFYRNAFGCVQY